MPENHEGFDPSQSESWSTLPEEYKKNLEHQQQKLGRFKLAQKVNIKRSSGAVESDWMVTGYNEARDSIVLMETGKGVEETTMQRFVKMEDLERWNPE